MPTQPRHLRWVVALLVSLAACSDDLGLGTNGAASNDLHLAASPSELAQGERLTLHAMIGGAVLDGRQVAWTARNTTAMSVTDGVVRALAPGMGYVVASRGGRADSVALVVRFPGRVDGGAIFQLAGSADDPIRLSGLAVMLESLRSGTRNTNIIAHSHPAGTPLSALDAAFSGDSILSIRLPREVVVGRRSLGAFTVEQTSGLRVSGDEGIFLRLRETDRRWRMYFSVGSATLEVTSVQLPAAMGNVPGRLTGRVQFDAAGFLHTVDDRGAQHLTPIGDRVIPIYAEFSVDLYHHPVSCLVAEVGGRYAGTARMGGRGAVDGNTLVVSWNGLLDFGTPNETYVESTLRLGGPGVGTFPLTSAAGGAASFATRFARFVRIPPGDDPIGQIEDPVTGSASAGTFVVSEYRAPGADNFGVVRGQLSATLEFPGGGSAATVSIADFVLPIVPLKGDVLDPSPKAGLASEWRRAAARLIASPDAPALTPIGAP